MTASSETCLAALQAHSRPPMFQHPHWPLHRKINGESTAIPIISDWRPVRAGAQAHYSSSCWLSLPAGVFGAALELEEAAPRSRIR